MEIFLQSFTIISGQKHTIFCIKCCDHILHYFADIVLDSVKAENCQLRLP